MEEDAAVSRYWDLVRGILLHSIMIPPWTMGFFAMLGATGALAVPSMRGSGAAAWVAMLTVMCSKLPASDRFVRFVYGLEPASYYRSGGGDVTLGGELASMQKERCVYCFHPHGILAGGFSWNGCWSEEFNRRAGKCNFLIDRLLRERNPIFKIICDLSGRLESLTLDNMRKFMGEGRNIALMPGGFSDATVFKFGQDRVVADTKLLLVTVKYALEHGYSIVPIYTFGESETFHAMQSLLNRRLQLNAYSIPAVAFYGDKYLPAFPRRETKLQTVVGSPLQLPMIANPSKEDVEEWKGHYLAALKTLFDGSKESLGRPDVQLELWTLTHRSKL